MRTCRVDPAGDLEEGVVGAPASACSSAASLTSYSLRAPSLPPMYSLCPPASTHLTVTGFGSVADPPPPPPPAAAPAALAAAAAPA